MFNFIQKNDSNSQKKLVTLKNPKLVDGLVKDEAITNGMTDSAVIENAVLTHFLNSDDTITFAVVNCLFQENGIAKVCNAIFSYLVAMPEAADDSLLPLLDYITMIELRHRTIINGNEDILTHFVSCIDSLLNLIKKYYGGKYDPSGYYFPSTDLNDRMLPQVHDTDLDLLNDLLKIKETPEYINTGTYFALLVMLIKRMWLLGHNNYNGGIRNWTYTYRILADYTSLAHWPCLPQYRNELIHTVKKITFQKDNSVTLTENVPVLNRSIYLRGHNKLITTEDALIFLADPSIPESECTRAARISHLSSLIRTEHPYILLYTDDHIPQINNIAERIVLENNLLDFKSVKDIAVDAIISFGVYRDERIRWDTV